LLTAHTFAQSPDTHGIGLSATDADTQFRIDFFEFYVLLERCLLHLLASVGVRVSAGYDPNRVNPLSTTTSTANTHTSSATNPQQERGGGNGIIGDSKVGASALATRGPAHAFHQNLLDALSSPRENPLYAILGTGRVREYIGLAKDLRNGWKESGSSGATASDGVSIGGNHGHGHGRGDAHVSTGDTLENGGVEAEAQRLHERLGRRYAEVLRELRLDEMLRVVLGAVEEAGVVAGREVERFVAMQDGVGARRISVDMTDATSGVGMDEQQHRGERPLESMGLGAGWEGDEMEFD
ncbi:MAG: hypothetical protein INR71_12495, partial [Terriglobus roseus]|nr:hypothetical protein [Terriglobus roseus]